MSVVDSPTTSHVPTFADLLNELFERRLHRDGRPYTVEEVAMAFPVRAPKTHLYKLRSGEIREPRRPTIAALCRIFQVDSSYFFPELADVVPVPLAPRPFDERS